MFVQPVYSCDVWMIQRRESARLAFEARVHCRVSGQIRPNDFDRHGAAELQLLRPVNFTHSAFAERSKNSISAGEDFTRLEEWRSRRMRPRVLGGGGAVRHNGSHLGHSFR